MATGAIIGLALAAVAGGLSAASSIQAGKAAEKQAKFNAAVAKNDALAAQEKLKFQQKRIKDRRKRILGAQRAAAGKGGFTPESIEALAIDSAIQSDLDLAGSRFGGRRAIQRARDRAGLARVTGKNRRSAAKFEAAGGILGSFSNQGGNIAAISG